MRVILSRKGFDSKNGGVPSPIFSDRSLVSLPIPCDDENGPPSFESLRNQSTDLGALVEDLTQHRQKRIPGNRSVHLDPDLDHSIQPRPAGWRPAFGQVRSAQGHLANQGVERGDLFLFFGWFRQVERVGGTWRYVKGSPNIHVLFGWLQIEEIWSFATQYEAAVARHPWLETHAHADIELDSNTVYVSRPRLKLNGKASDTPGAGAFRKFDAALQLTWPNETRRWWRLPRWFEPVNGKPPLSYHLKRDAWRRREGFMQLRTVGIGQEFVLDCDHYPEAVEWAAELIERHQ